MANPIGIKAAIRAGLGLCTLHPLTVDDVGKTVLDLTNTEDTYFTGRLYKQRVVQISSGFTVSAEGTVTGNLETTDYGPGAQKFLNRYAPMYRNPRDQAAGAGFESLVDETSWTDDENTETANIPIKDQLLAIQWGGEYIDTVDENSWYAPVDIAIVSIGNDTLTMQNTANTWRRRNFVLNGHFPQNDIIIPIDYLQQFAENNNIGIKVEGAENSITVSFLI